jgi:antitoxin HicB
MFGYCALFEPDPKQGGFVVTFPDLGHGATQGETIEEAMEMAEDLLRSIVGGLMKSGEEFPRAAKHRGKKFCRISLPVLQSAKAELYSAFRASRIRKAELARRIGIPKTNVDRIFDLDHASRLDQIEAAFQAIGKKIEIRISNAA